MKVSIVTLHRVFNYGSILQAYASQKMFENNGYDTEIIDYITEQRTLKRQFNTIPNTVKKDFFHKNIYLLFKSFSLYLKQKTFGNFMKKNINLTSKKYITQNDLMNDPPKSDIYITGSDQVWNSKYNEGIDKGFYLDFTNSPNKYAYVSSFGMDKIPKDEKSETLKLLKKYKKISVREDNAEHILDDLGIKKHELLIDPTLQLKKEDWRALESKRLIKDKYVLLMLLYNEDNNATEYAREIADKLGYKLVKLSWEMKKPKKVDKLFTHRTPQDFLSLFDNAEFIVTNSFHGLAFSINLNKEFIVVKRNEFNSRIDSLLRLTSLESRQFDKDYFDLSIINKKIDYNKVNKILDKEREKANSFINSIKEN